MSFLYGNEEGYQAGFSGQYPQTSLDRVAGYIGSAGETYVSSLLDGRSIFFLILGCKIRTSTVLILYLLAPLYFGQVTLINCFQDGDCPSRDHLRS